MSSMATGIFKPSFWNFENLLRNSVISRLQEVLPLSRLLREADSRIVIFRKVQKLRSRGRPELKGISLLVWNFMALCGWRHEKMSYQTQLVNPFPIGCYTSRLRQRIYSWQQPKWRCSQNGWGLGSKTTKVCERQHVALNVRLISSTLQ